MKTRRADSTNSRDANTGDAISPWGKQGDSHPWDAHIEVYFRSPGAYAAAGPSPRLGEGSFSFSLCDQILLTLGSFLF